MHISSGLTIFIENNRSAQGRQIAAEEQLCECLILSYNKSTTFYRIVEGSGYSYIIYGASSCKVSAIIQTVRCITFNINPNVKNVMVHDVEKTNLHLFVQDIWRIRLLTFQLYSFLPEYFVYNSKLHVFSRPHQYCALLLFIFIQPKIIDHCAIITEELRMKAVFLLRVFDKNPALPSDRILQKNPLYFKRLCEKHLFMF